jgi:protein SCO1/2
MPSQSSFCKHSRIFLFSILFALIQSYSYAQTPPKTDTIKIGLVEHLGQQLPLDVELIDENGQKIKFGTLFNKKPVLLTLVYYKCPGICSPLLNGVVTSVDKMNSKPGRDFQMITISFDPSDEPRLGKQKKEAYFAQFQNQKLSSPDWRFLTADSATIQKITEAIGFRYQRAGTEWAHVGFVTTISPQGKISRYLNGIEFLPFDLQMALNEASLGKTGPTVAAILSYCYRYDKEKKSYIVNITRITGIVMLLVLGIFAFILIFVKKQSQTKPQTKELD